MENKNLRKITAYFFADPYEKGVTSTQIAKRIISEQGVPGFWRGTVASLWRQG